MSPRSMNRLSPPIAASLLRKLLATALAAALSVPLPCLLAQPARSAPLVSVLPAPNSSATDSVRPARLLAVLQSAAAAGSPELASRRAQLEAARTRAGATGMREALSLSAGLSEAPNASLDQGNVRVELGRELFTGPRRRAEREVADVGVRAAERALETAERRVRLATWREAIHAAGTRLIAARLSAEDALLMGGEDGVRARFSVGQARYVDVLRLRSERLRVQTERAAMLAESRAAVAMLSGLLGLRNPLLAGRPAQDTRLAEILDSLATVDLADAWRVVLPEVASSETMMDSVVAAAGDVRMAEAEVSRARAAAALATARRRPQVSALAGLQRIGQANNGPALGPSLGVTLSLPFTARSANGLSAAADAGQIVATESARTATVAAVRARVEAAAERFAAARERLSVFDAALLRGARDERESALASYRSGGLSLLELVDFERALARAEIDRIRALMDAASAWAELSSGGDSAEAPALTTSGSGPGESSDAR